MTKAVKGVTKAVELLLGRLSKAVENNKKGSARQWVTE